MKCWLLLAGFVGFAAVAFAIYYYMSTQEFEITGELLYKNEQGDVPDVRHVAGANIEVFEDKGKGPLPGRYFLLVQRQLALALEYPGEVHDSKRDVDLAPLSLALLSKMDWTWWGVERLHNCGRALQLFREAQGGLPTIATTSTNVSGHFWLKLRRGKYFITANGEVPSFWRLEDDPLHRPDTSAAATGNAFWKIPITVTGNMKVVSASPDCSP